MVHGAARQIVAKLLLIILVVVAIDQTFRKHLLLSPGELLISGII